jgi:hypothetical protein
MAFFDGIETRNEEGHGTIYLKKPPTPFGREKFDCASSKMEKSLTLSKKLVYKKLSQFQCTDMIHTLIEMTLIAMSFGKQSTLMKV